MSGTTKPGDGLETQLLHLLRFSGLDKENLKELVAIVVGLQGKGLGPFRVFPRGIFPVTDGLALQAHVAAADLSKILGAVVQIPRLGGVSIFPYGIVNHEIFQVNVAIGNTVEASAQTAGI
jgi:hypothetical protein